MKKIFFSKLTNSAILHSACNNNGSKSETEKHDMNNMSKSLVLCKGDGDVAK